MAILAIAAAATLLIWHQPTWSLHILQAAFCLACAVTLWRRRTLSTPSCTQWVAISCLAAAALTGLIQNVCGTSAVPAETAKASLEWGTLTAVFVSMALARQPDRLLSICAAIGVTICLIATAQFYTAHGNLFWFLPNPEPQPEPRILGPFLSRNNYASYALLVLPLTLWKARTAKALSEINWYWLAAGAAIYASVIASGSRAGAVLATLEIPVFYLYSPSRSKRSALAFLVLAGLAVTAAGWEYLGNKVTDDNPLRYRREMIQSALEMAKQKPLTGWGLGVYPQVYPHFASFDTGLFVNHAHSDWAEWASEGGVPLLSGLLVAGLLTAKAALRRPWALGVVAVFLHALLDYPMQRLGVAVWVAILTALALASHSHKSASSGNSASSVTL